MARNSPCLRYIAIAFRALDPPNQHENDHNDQDDADKTDATMTITVAVAAEAAEAAEQTRMITRISPSDMVLSPTRGFPCLITFCLGD